jgi:hypothetical protein
MNHAIFEPSDSSSWTSSGEGSSYYVTSGDGSGGRQLRIQRKVIIAGGEKETVDDFFILEWDPHYSVGWNHQTRPQALDRSSSQEFEA